MSAYILNVASIRVVKAQLCTHSQVTHIKATFELVLLNYCYHSDFCMSAATQPEQHLDVSE